jgi:adenylyltransferase/sulfurtransferase
VAELTRDELERYARHLVLPHVGVQGQERLKEGRILCVGAGGLGSPLALYLAAAGVGTIGLVDFDRVDASNLQRQVLHGTSDVGRPKVESARDRLLELNPHVRVEVHEGRLDASNALHLFADYDAVADGTDNFPTRYLVNDACVLAGKPNVHGSVFRFEGQASVFAHAGGPCYRCLYPEPPPPDLVPSCADGGVLGILPGVIGLIQATEVVKLLLGLGETLAGRLLLYDALAMRFREMRIRRDPDCPVCGEHPSITTLSGSPTSCSGSPGAAPAGESDDEGREVPFEVAAAEVARRLAAADGLAVLDVREPAEWAICRLEDSHCVALATLPAHLDELDPARPWVVVCHTGVRSAYAVRFLRSRGFLRAQSLAGGLDAWAREVDPSLPRY